MTLRQIGAVVVCALALSISAAEATQRQNHARADSGGLTYCAADQSYRSVCRGEATRTTARREGRAVAVHGDPRPHAWCGWWLRHELNVADRAGNLARWWARFGANAHGPAIGTIVVWPHHVGIITARSESGWVVKSGNDGHAVRERERSLAGAIAFRWPNQWASR